MGLSIENPTWKTLYRAGGIAALLAAILFRRNIGAEVSLFTGVEAIPHSAADWYALLQSNPFVGLSFLAVFDLVDYALVGLVFLALAAALWSSHRSMAAIALASGMVGVCGQPRLEHLPDPVFAQPAICGSDLGGAASCLVGGRTGSPGSS